MSRVGNKPITLSSGVTVTSAGQVITVKGPKGSLTETLPHHLSIQIEGNELQVKRANDTEEVKKYHAKYSQYYPKEDRVYRVTNLETGGMKVIR